MNNKLGHKERFSDSSLYDYVCDKCGATDAAGDDRLEKPCPKSNDLIEKVSEAVIEAIEIKGMGVFIRKGKAQQLIALIQESQEQVGWYNPQSKRFCYLDQKDPKQNVAGADRFSSYSVPVFALPKPPKQGE